MRSGRTPSGVRGLKVDSSCNMLSAVTSHPVRGAWIEIARKAQVLQEIFVAPRQGCVD